jgi:type I restriction enzyme, S subunit
VAAAEWEEVELAEVARHVKREITLVDDREYQRLTIRLRGQGIGVRDRVAGAKVKTKKQSLVYADDLVVAEIDAKVGGFGIAPPECEGAIVSSHYFVFELDRERVIPEWIDALCRAHHFTAQVEAQGSTNYAAVRPAQVLEYTLPAPPLDEQQAIVDVLSSARHALAAADEERVCAFLVLRGAIDALVSSADGSYDPPGDWELRELAQVADVRSGITKGRKTDEPVEPVPFMRAANVQDGYLDLGEIRNIEVTVAEKLRFRLEPGDVLLVEGGNAEHLGRGWIWSDEIQGCLHQNHVFRARPDRELVEPRFLAYVIASSPARAYCLNSAKKTTNLASINKTQISALPVPLPPLEMQKEIVAKLDAIRAAGVEAHHVRVRLRDLYASLLDSLVSGERRVRESAPGLEELATA